MTWSGCDGLSLAGWSCELLLIEGTAGLVHRLISGRHNTVGDLADFPGAPATSILRSVREDAGDNFSRMVFPRKQQLIPEKR